MYHTQHTDIAIIGAGASGCLAAKLLDRQGFKISLIDRYAVFPPEFRAEQFAGPQIKRLDDLGVLTRLVEGVPLIQKARNYNQAREISSVRAPHYGLPYQQMVMALRDQVPPTVNFMVGRARDIAAGPQQTITLDDGRTITADLVIMATGLNTTLARHLGVTHRQVSKPHSTTVGFDITSPIQAADRAVLVFYGNGMWDRIDYLTIFQCGDGLRGNLFTYREPRDPWYQALRANPSQFLLQTFPVFRDQLSQITIENVQVRRSDITVLEDHYRHGIVYIGDAFQTPCPAAGTGFDRLINDVVQLTDHVSAWFERGDFSAASLQSFYHDPIKQKGDKNAIYQAQFRRALTTDPSMFWALQRKKVAVKRFIKHSLHTVSPVDRISFAGMSGEFVAR